MRRDRSRRRNRNRAAALPVQGSDLRSSRELSQRAAVARMASQARRDSMRLVGRRIKLSDRLDSRRGLVKHSPQFGSVLGTSRARLSRHGSGWVCRRQPRMRTVSLTPRPTVETIDSFILSSYEPHRIHELATPFGATAARLDNSRELRKSLPWHGRAGCSISVARRLLSRPHVAGRGERHWAGCVETAVPRVRAELACWHFKVPLPHPSCIPAALTSSRCGKPWSTS